MFLIRRLLFFLAIPAVLFLGGSAVIESFAESQLSNGMRSTLDLGSRPKVQIDGFPILYRIVQGRIPRVRVDARSVVIEGLEIANLSMDMEGVEASLDVLVRRNKFDLTVDRGSGVALVAEAAINSFIKNKEIDAVVALREDGIVAVTAQEVIGGRRRTFAATGSLTLGRRVLSFKPTRFTMDGKPVPSELRARARRETTFSVEIPKLPAGILPSEVAVKEGELSLIANFDGFVLKVR